MKILQRIYANICGSVYVVKEKVEDDSILKDLNRLSQRDFKSLNIRLRVSCEHGEIKDERKYKALSKNIYEFKTRNYRILCFKLPNKKPTKYILLSFFKKCPKKEYKSKIKTAENQRTKILSLLDSGGIKEEI